MVLKSTYDARFCLTEKYLFMGPKYKTLFIHVHGFVEGFRIKKCLAKHLYLMWGPIVYGPGPFTRRESKGPSRRELWPKTNNVEV